MPPSQLGRVKWPASEHPSSLDIAWAAGIYEGEGSCRGGDTTAAQVSQKDPWLLHKFARLFGGRVGPHKCREEVYFQWQCSGALARGFLMTIYPLMSPRRKAQIREVLPSGH